MGKNIRKRFSCGHRGLGEFCHRCEAADKLEELVKAGRPFVDYKKREKPRKWSKEEVLAEIKRLRNDGKGR